MDNGSCVMQCGMNKIFTARLIVNFCNLSAPLSVCRIQMLGEKVGEI